MKTLLLGIAVLGAVGAGALFHHCAQQYRTQQPVPAIGVKIVEEDGWAGSTKFLPAINGYSSASNSVSVGISGENEGYEVNASYQIASSSPEHFFVLAHYKITRNGISTEVDKALPVLPYYKPSPLAEEKLKRATWTNLDDHLNAFAYLSEQTLYY